MVESALLISSINIRSVLSRYLLVFSRLGNLYLFYIPWHRLGVQRLGPLADYLVINVSSPNTPGKKAVQAKQQFYFMQCNAWKLKALRYVKYFKRKKTFLFASYRSSPFCRTKKYAGKGRAVQSPCHSVEVSTTNLGYAAFLRSFYCTSCPQGKKRGGAPSTAAG